MQREGGHKLAVFGDIGNLILKVSREVGGGRIWAPDVGRCLEAEW